MIIANELYYKYMQGTMLEKAAIKNVNIKIEKGELVGIIGHTGSGKSTLAQLFNGLLRPSSGEVFINEISTKSKSLKEIREKVGLVFQYPEHQLFEESVYRDIAYGLFKKGFSDNMVMKRVSDVIKLVGLKEEILEKSPTALSGGQMRRVAIAGILVLEPEILILDEPTSGLDPIGRKELYDIMLKLNAKKGTTIIVISHKIDEIARYMKRVVVMNDGSIVMDGKVKDIFSNKDGLESYGLAVPEITCLMKNLSDIIPDLNTNIITVDEAVEEILKHLGGKGFD